MPIVSIIFKSYLMHCLQRQESLEEKHEELKKETK